MRRFKRAAAVSAVVLLTMLGLSGPAWAASATLAADAEAGTLAGFGSTSNAAAVAGAAKTGSYGYRIDTTASGGYVQWTSTDVEQNHEWASFSMLARVNSRGTGESVDLISVKNNNSVDHFDLFLTPTNEIKWDLHNGDEDVFTPAALNTWYVIEGRVYFGATTYTAQVRINGVDQGTISSTGMVATTVRGVWFGTSNAKTHQQDYDDLEFQVDESDVGYIGPTYTAPTVATNCSQLTLRATVNPGGEETGVVFQYGTTTSMTSSTASQSAGSGTSNVVVSSLITPAGTTTYYRAVASNLGGITNGVMKTETCT